jgi:hypothetical protein
MSSEMSYPSPETIRRYRYLSNLRKSGITYETIEGCSREQLTHICDKLDLIKFGKNEQLITKIRQTMLDVERMCKS